MGMDSHPQQKTNILIRGPDVNTRIIVLIHMNLGGFFEWSFDCMVGKTDHSEVDLNQGSYALSHSRRKQCLAVVSGPQQNDPVSLFSSRFRH